MTLYKQMRLALQIENHLPDNESDRLAHFKDENTGYMPRSISKAIEELVRRDAHTIKEGLRLIVKYKRLGVTAIDADIAWLKSDIYMGNTKSCDTEEHD